MIPLLYSSYPEQHGAEVMKLFEVVQTMDVPVLMGDFNHGPGGPGQRDNRTVSVVELDVRWTLSCLVAQVVEDPPV